MEPTQETRRVLSEGNAYILKSILTGPIIGNDPTAPYCKISGQDVGGKLELQQIIMTDGSVDLQIIIQLLHGMDLINQKICILQKQMVLTELQDFGLLL